MKKTIKLDRSMLRGLIKEAIQGRQPGDPLWSPTVEHLVKEGLGDDLAEELGGLVGPVLEREFSAMFSSNDPVQSAYGKDEWDVQVEEAVNDAVERVLKAVDTVTKKLHRGDYYMG